MTNKKTIKISVKLPNVSKEKTVSFVSSGYTLFFNAQHLLIELTSQGRAFYDYLCEQMNGINNNVTINTSLKENFIAHIERITSKKHSLSLRRVTIYKNQLIKLNLLIEMSTKQSEFYCINPKYAFKGTSINRKKLLKQQQKILQK